MGEYLKEMEKEKREERRGKRWWWWWSWVGGWKIVVQVKGMLEIMSFGFKLVVSNIGKRVEEHKVERGL